MQSLKYEIWASTDLGNKRLDRAFRESADKGPIYLFFSVNARYVLCLSVATAHQADSSISILAAVTLPV